MENLSLTKTGATKYYLHPIEELCDRNRNHVAVKTQDFESSAPGAVKWVQKAKMES